MNTITTTRNNKTTAFGKYGKLHVFGKNLYDSNNNIISIKGVSTHNLSSFPEYVNEDTFAWLVDECNCEIIRLAMYSSEADGDAGYSDGSESHKEELINLITKGVKLCADLGVYCLVDWHILFDYNPNFNRESAIEFWKKICPLLKNYDNVIYEICNEPNMNLETKEIASWENIKQFANEVIPIIRSIDSEKIIIVGTPIWSQNVDEAADDPLSFENIMYTLHFYADSHRESLREKMVYALSKNLPMFVTEYGPCDASGNGDINEEETMIWLNALNSNSISYIVWNLSNKAESSAFIKPNCNKLSAFDSGELTPGGVLMKKALLL